MASGSTTTTPTPVGSRPQPNLPDTCFCDRCLSQFQQRDRNLAPRSADGRASPADLGCPTSRPGCDGGAASSPTGSASSARSSTEERPGALLGTFHCPWSDSDYDNAIARQAGHRPESPRLDISTSFDHALPRAVRSCDRSRLDLAPDGLAGTISGDQGRAGRTAQDLADRATIGLGRDGSGVPGRRGARPRNPAAGDRSHGLRLGDVAPAMGEGDGDAKVLPRDRPSPGE